MRIIGMGILAVLLMMTPEISNAQSYAFGFKGGVGGGMQIFKNFGNRGVLLTYNGAAFIESAEEGVPYSLYAQAGVHQRGSRRVLGQGFTIGRSIAQSDIFTNAALILGAKQKFDFLDRHKWYYGFGVRGEYTIKSESDNLSEEAQDFAVRRWLWGITFSVGMEWHFSEYMAGLVELSIHPDMSRQMFIPRQTVQLPGSSTPRQIPEQSPSNVTVELTVGLRFLHKIEYID